jgi:hypothetical protein
MQQLNCKQDTSKMQYLNDSNDSRNQFQSPPYSLHLNLHRNIGSITVLTVNHNRNLVMMMMFTWTNYKRGVLTNLSSTCET